MVRGAKSEKGAQRRSLRLSVAFTKIALSQQKQPGTDTGQVSK
jgi:hypothetical protein